MTDRDDALSYLNKLSSKMAEDEGLWFVAQTASEAYLQQELRKLCVAIECAYKCDRIATAVVAKAAAHQTNLIGSPPDNQAELIADGLIDYIRAPYSRSWLVERVRALTARPGDSVPTEGGAKEFGRALYLLNELLRAPGPYNRNAVIGFLQKYKFKKHGSPSPPTDTGGGRVKG